jgi:hemerythrin
MESIGYQGLDAQKRAHQIFIRELDEINEDEIRRNTQEYTKSLVEFLLGWLINHILKVDKQIPLK